MLGTSRKKGADVRAQAKAAKNKAKAEAKIAAAEAKKKAKADHKIEAATKKARAKVERRAADAADKRQNLRARKAEERAAARAHRLDSKEEKARMQLDKAARKQVHKELKARSKQDKNLTKIEKAGRKHELKMAELEIQKAEKAKFGKKDAQRWLTVAQVAVPLALPLIYRSMSQIQSGGGLGALESRVAGPATTLDARLQRISDSLDQLAANHPNDSGISEFVSSTRNRVTDLRAAVDSAETMPTAQRREIHSSITSEVDKVNRDVLARLGVKA